MHIKNKSECISRLSAVVVISVRSYNWVILGALKFPAQTLDLESYKSVAYNVCWSLKN